MSRLHSITAIGERRLEGDYRRVRVMGQLEMPSGSVELLRVMGQAALTGVRAGRIHCMGRLKATDCQLGQLTVTGELAAKGVCQAGDVRFVGQLQAELLECRLLLHGPANQEQRDTRRWTGAVRAVTLENQLPLELACDCEAENILSSAPMTALGELACERFYSFGPLRAPAVNAEELVLVPGGPVRVLSMAGGRVRVLSRWQPDQAFQAIPKQGEYPAAAACPELAVIDVIEGDQVQVEGARVRQVGGGHVFIGDLSVVDRVEYSGSLRVSDKAVVGEVVKL